MEPDKSIAIGALVVSIGSLLLSIYFWAKTFRPIVTAMVKTHEAGKKGIVFNLEIRNSGSLPAKNIRLIPNKNGLKDALGDEATYENRKTEIACFKKECTILILHNDSVVHCSFGDSKENNTGFWKYGAKIPITIEYEGWLGWLGKWKPLQRCYEEHQMIQIQSSASFTGYELGERSHKKTSQKVTLDDLPKTLKQLSLSVTVNDSTDDSFTPT